MTKEIQNHNIVNSPRFYIMPSPPKLALCGGYLQISTFRLPQNMDSGVWGLRWGSPVYGNCHMMQEHAEMDTAGFHPQRNCSPVQG